MKGPTTASGGAPGRAQQPEGSSALYRFGPGVNVQLRVELAHMRLDGVDRQVQLLADIAGGQVGRQEAQHGELAFAQCLVRLGDRLVMSRRLAARELIEHGPQVSRVCCAMHRMGLQQLPYAWNREEDPYPPMRLG